MKKVDGFVERVKGVTAEWNGLAKTMDGTQRRAKTVND